jgi:NADH-quinone oxidoreductase subunit M
MNMREGVAIWPLAVLALIMGVASPLWMKAIDPATTATLAPVHRAEQAKKTIAPPPTEASVKPVAEAK